MATPKQEKLIKIVLENLGSLDKTKTLGEMLKEAGYSEAMQKNPQMVFESQTIKDGLASVIDDLELLRKQALDELKARDISKERYSDIVKGIDTFTKNHQLLTGGDTEKQNISIEVVNYGENNNTA